MPVSSVYVTRWEQKLPKSKSALESTWLYHEIGRCHLELGENSEAKDFGEKSLAAAQEADDRGWQLHATVLVAQAEGWAQCVQYADLTICFSSFSGKTPQHLSDLLGPCTPTRQLRSASDTRTFVISRVNTKIFGER